MLAVSVQFLYQVYRQLYCAVEEFHFVECELSFVVVMRFINQVRCSDVGQCQLQRLLLICFDDLFGHALSSISFSHHRVLIVHKMCVLYCEICMHTVKIFLLYTDCTTRCICDKWNLCPFVECKLVCQWGCAEQLASAIWLSTNTCQQVHNCQLPVTIMLQICLDINDKCHCWNESLFDDFCQSYAPSLVSTVQ